MTKFINEISVDVSLLTHKLVTCLKRQLQELDYGSWTACPVAGSAAANQARVPSAASSSSCSTSRGNLARLASPTSPWVGSERDQKKSISHGTTGYGHEDEKIV